VIDPSETGSRRAGSRLSKRAQQAVANRRVFPYLAMVTAIIAVSTGVIAHAIDRTDFPTLEDGIWWAIVTLGTVGYGDIVPHTTWGRILGSVVIIFGVTFISFLVATVTSLFVEGDRKQRDEMQTAFRDHVGMTLESIDVRLAAIESSLATKSDPTSGR
jgi:voltage-gated potassium channel